MITESEKVGVSQYRQISHCCEATFRCWKSNTVTWQIEKFHAHQLQRCHNS